MTNQFNIVPIDGGVCASLEFEAGVASAGIKNINEKRLDCTLLVSKREAVVSGVFTTNRVKAHPVHWCQKVCNIGVARAVFANSGNANACTGEQGAQDVEEIAREVSNVLGISKQAVLVLSTGVIGVPLPMDRIKKGIYECARTITPENHLHSARAIMTTDTVPKEYAVAVQLSKGIIHIGGMAKGAGMICPNMATMLAVLTTDASIEKKYLDILLSEAVNRSFNCISVDNDMSTNDSVIVLANGASGIRVEPNTEDGIAFQEAFLQVCQRLAKSIVYDGEGATKFVEIGVKGAKTEADAKTVAKTIANSQLCKTAFFGGDPNWGRIVCAVGYSGVEIDINKLSVSIGNIKVFDKGIPTDYEESAVSEIMKKREFTVWVDLGIGHAESFYWTSDLSYDYVKINADYRT